MEQRIQKMLADLKQIRISVRAVEIALGFSNGLIGKAVNGHTNLSEAKMVQVEAYYHKQIGLESKRASKLHEIEGVKRASEIPPKPVIDNECRQVKDHCKQFGVSVEEVLSFHREAITKPIKKTKAVEREEKRANESNTNSRDDIRRKKLGF